MHRCPMQTNESMGTNNEFHLDIPSIPIWHNNSMTPVHVQLLPTNVNQHPAGLDHLMSNSSENFEQNPYLHQNYLYSPSAAHGPFSNNGTIYFAPSPSQAHFHPFHPNTTFENSNRPQFHPFPGYPPSGIYPPTTFLSSNPREIQHFEENSALSDSTSRFRHPKTPENDNRTISSSASTMNQSNSTRYHHEHRFHPKPSFSYDNSSYSTSTQNTNNSTNHFNRSTNNYRHQRTQPTLPLSAYMNIDDTSDFNLKNQDQQWNHSFQKRRSNLTKPSHQDKHQFPLSSYDPRQFNFNNQRRSDLGRRTNVNRRSLINNRTITNEFDTIDQFWQDNNDDSSIGTAKMNDSGHGSLSTSLVNIKEITTDEQQIQYNDSINSSSSPSNTDQQILHSLDQLEQHLTLEEALDECLDKNIDEESKASGTYNTAHFLQWAKKTFRKELAGRLTAQEIQQHDAVTEEINPMEEIETDEQQILKSNESNLENVVDSLPDALQQKLSIEPMNRST